MRRTTTCRQVRRAARTSWLKPSDSARRSQTAETAPSNSSRSWSCGQSSQIGDVAHAQPEVVDVQGRAVGAVDLERLLVDDLDAHVGEDRQDVGERERVDPEQLEPADVRGRVGRAVERDARAPAVAELVEVGQVGLALVDRERLLVGRGERPPEPVHEAVAGLLAVRRAQGVAEAVGPGAADLDEALLEGVQLGLLEHAHPPALRDPDDELQPGERGLADPRAELDRLARRRCP